MTRTDEQRFADAFDLELFRLARRAATHAEGKVRQRERAQWLSIAQTLAAARGPVRRFMHPQDVARTSEEP